MLPLVGATGEFLLNVRVDDRELLPNPTTVAVLGPIRSGESVRVEWDGVQDPAPDDWIGVFPVNGLDKDRLTFVFTGGAASGTTSVFAQLGHMRNGVFFDS